ncbi:uncharacterized protein LOC135439416 isoform X1 [Drosophila montana]|uniref:uncharacterized protein LOC135439416 isoform X1 n=1 Tax=Drosophila montana TaxID=40370 RepID=UPI00313BEA74
MFRRLAFKNGKLALVALLLIFIFIFVNRDPNGGDERRTQTTTVHSTRFNVKSTTRKQANKPATPIKEFCVFDHKCKIPRIDPFSQDAMTYFKTPKFKECTNQPDLLTVRFDRQKRQYVVHVNVLVSMKLLPNLSDFSCAYSEIMRGPNDSLTWNVGPYYFDQDWVVPRRIQGIIVECYEFRNKSRIIQRNAFSFIQHQSDRDEKIDEERTRNHPSVIMLGIDSMSQMNFQRAMPLTAQFVRQLGWYEMLGYNKIGDNTLPNMMALLTGLTTRQWRSKCDLEKPGCFDSFTYLWNNFRNAGYLTAYAEDTPSIDTFHYILPGFIRQPVDYYLRPFLMVIQQLLVTVKHYGYDYCLGRRQSFRYVFDYCLQLVQRFVDETPKPVFGVFWSNSFSHDDFRGAASVDKDFVRYLELFKKHRLFEKAVVILFSDHGQRQGALMELTSSFLEERLPMLHIYLPPWYRKQYPEVAHALDVNRRRLSSTVDLHLTVKNFVQQADPGLLLESPCLKCQSLLQILPVNRSCEDASIPEHWCTCDSYLQVPCSDLLKYWARKVVNLINMYLSTNNYDKKCHRLKLSRLQRAERMQHFDENGNDVMPSSRLQTYRIKFTTQPNGGLFRATFLTDWEGKVQVRNEFITRLNSYRNESFCISDRIAKMFCACLKARLKTLYDVININDNGTPMDL